MILRPAVAMPLQEGLAKLARLLPTDMTTDAEIAEYRRIAESRGTSALEVAARFDLETSEIAAGITVFSAGTARLRTVFLHGGGLIAGNRFDGADVLAQHSRELEMDVWTVEYPLVPEAGYDEMVEIAVSAVAAAAAGGIPVVLAGQSAGGGLAAATALVCRDRGVPLAGVLLVCPMLDARATLSAEQFADDPAWSRRSNITGWTRALAGSETLPPSERNDLAGLPPVFLDAGSAELFRDSIVGFAGALWSQGVSAELHVWSGGFHGSDCFVPDAVVSSEAHRARGEWLRRVRDGGV